MNYSSLGLFIILILQETKSLKIMPSDVFKAAKVSTAIAFQVFGACIAHADGLSLFTQSCVGCHAGGGNILPFQGGKIFTSRPWSRMDITMLRPCLN